MPHHYLFHGLIVNLLLLLSGTAWGADHDFTFTLEDDFFAGRDYGYTGGLQFGWGESGDHNYANLAPSWAAALAHHLWLDQGPARARAVSYKLGIAAYTPRDIATRTPPGDDLPYSGLLYWQGALQAADACRADQAYLTLGLIGPASGTAAVQKAIHHLTSSQQPEGWSSQLDNEPVFKLGAGRKWRSWYRDRPDSPWGMDLVTTAELGAGLLDSTADLGLSWRFGENLLRSFPQAGLTPGRDINPLAGQPSDDMNFFVTVMARYQPNAIYVQGNTFGGQQTDLTLRREQYWWSGGVLWNHGRWAYEFAMVRSTRLFAGPNASQDFGSLSITFQY